MFDKSISAMVQFDAVLIAAEKVRSDAFKEIHANYKGSLATNKLNEARKAYTETVESERDKTIEAIQTEMGEILKLIGKMATKPIEADAGANLTALKLMGKNITDAEINLYLERYSDNYTMCRAIAQIAVDAGMTQKRYKIQNVTAVLDLVHELEAFLIREVKNRNSGARSYNYRVALAETGLLFDLGAKVSAFLSGDFTMWEHSHSIADPKKTPRTVQKIHSRRKDEEQEDEVEDDE